MERHIGIGSAAGAVEPYIRAAGHVWCDVTYEKPGGLLERLPVPSRVRGTMRGVLQTSSALRSDHFDALCFLTHNPAVFQQRALARTPTMVWTDVTPIQLDGLAASYDHPISRSSLVGRAKTAIVRHTFQQAAACAGWSEWARRSFVEDYGVPRERTLVVAPGIDLKLWAYDEAQCEALRNENTLPRLLFVGGHFERKGGRILLEVYRSKLRGRCELDLVTRDDVPNEPGVRVHRGLSPKSPELVDLYRAANAFVLPTRGDCFSIASLEAMAMGLPVIVSASGGIADIVLQEQTGFLLRGEDIAPALQQALQVVLGDAARRQAMGRAGRARVERHFNAENTALALLRALEQLVAKTGSDRPRQSMGDDAPH